MRADEGAVERFRGVTANLPTGGSRTLTPFAWHSRAGPVFAAAIDLPVVPADTFQKKTEHVNDVDSFFVYGS
jgi:hypothetical protein